MIELQHLQKVAGQSVVFEIDSLEVASGEVAAISGSDQQSLLALFALLIGQSIPTSGTIRLAGLDPIRDREKLSLLVGVLFQENGLYERLSGRDNLLFYCQLRGLPARRADEVLEQVGLMDRSDVRVRRYPAGLARRLAFGRVILHQPSILLLMDPLRGCDRASRALLTRLIGKLGEQGKGVLILANDLTGIQPVCQTTYALESGRLARISSWPGETRLELPFKVPARQEGQVVLVNPAEILYISTAGSQTHLHTASGEISSHLSIGELEGRLAPNGFFRAHRSYLVNLQRVAKIVPYTRDSYTLILEDPSKIEIPLSKSAARELREILGY